MKVLPPDSRPRYAAGQLFSLAVLALLAYIGAFQAIHFPGVLGAVLGAVLIADVLFAMCRRSRAAGIVILLWAGPLACLGLVTVFVPHLWLLDYIAIGLCLVALGLFRSQSSGPPARNTIVI